jgi:glyoxylase-like metal-dependent hydrolase (beta-lactamase superfamily II)
MELASGLRVVLAPNPGLMTGPGTNQYLLGARDAVQLDVAPLDAENRRRLADEDVPVARLVLTHIHPDHVGGALDLDRPVAVHRSRAAFSLAGRPLAPATLLDDGAEIPWPGGRLVVVHTPGHESGHCCLYEPERRWLFTGDTVLRQVRPSSHPGSDMGAYLQLTARLRALDVATIFPGHGPPVEAAGAAGPVPRTPPAARRARSWTRSGTGPPRFPLVTRIYPISIPASSGPRRSPCWLT